MSFVLIVLKAIGFCFWTLWLVTGLFFYHDLASLSHSTAMLEITFFFWSWHVKMKRPLTILHRAWVEQLCQLTIETLEKETQQHNYTLLYTVKNNLVEVPVQYQTVPNNNNQVLVSKFLRSWDRPRSSPTFCLPTSTGTHQRSRTPEQS